MHKKSWRFTAVLQQLTISRLGASERVGPWFLPLNYCGRGENPKTECLLHHPCDLYIILQIGAHHPIPNVTATLKPTLALTTLESGSKSSIWCWYIKKSAKQICPNFGQIKRIKFQPGLAEVTTLIILPIKMSYHPNGTPARWLKALLQPQSPNRCFGAAWAQSGHSEVLQF